MSALSYPGSNVFYRRLGRTYPLVVRGEGAWLFDAEGRGYLDASSGAFVANLGHGVREIGEAMAEQAARIGYVNGTAFTSEPVEALAAELARRLPPPLDRLYFLCSGSEAVEAALKLARQHWVEVGRPAKHRILALTPAYHGNTLLALSASARAHYQTFYQEWMVDVHRVPAPYAYRCACGGAEDAACPACDGSALEAAIEEVGAERVAAFVIEPVGGSSTGHAVPRPGYLRRVREICDRHEVLLVADEVLVGAGRTGTWWAIEPSGVVPDIMVLGKGISGGYAPLSAVAASRRLIDPIARGSGALLHAQTFSHHPVLAAAGLAAIRYLEKHGLVERCRRMGALLHQRLAALRDLPHVGDVRGRGLLAGVEFVQDRVRRDPFPRRVRFAETFAEAALERGLVTWTNVGQANGVDGDLCCLAPPFVISEAEIDELVRRFTAALEEAVLRTRHG